MIHPATMKEHDRRAFTLRTVVHGFNAFKIEKMGRDTIHEYHRLSCELTAIKSIP